MTGTDYRITNNLCKYFAKAFGFNLGKCYYENEKTVQVVSNGTYELKYVNVPHSHIKFTLSKGNDTKLNLTCYDWDDAIMFFDFATEIIEGDKK